MRSTTIGPIFQHFDAWWQAYQQRAAESRRARWWRRALRENHQLWEGRAEKGEDPLPGTRLPPWAMDLLTRTGTGREPSLATLNHGGLIGVWRKHREPFEMLGYPGRAQEFLDTLEWARDRDQGPVWDVEPLRGDAREAPVLRWAQDVSAHHHASLFSAPLSWFAPDPDRARLVAMMKNGLRDEHRLPNEAHTAWRQGDLRVLDGTEDSNTPLQTVGIHADDEWPVVVVRWNPIALAVMTRRWDRVHAWSVKAPQAARDAQHLLTVLGKTPTPDQPQDVASWERWVLADLVQAPNDRVARERARL